MLNKMLCSMIIFCSVMHPIKLTADERPLQLVTVCDVLTDLKSYNGKYIAVLGRSTGTSEGTWLGDDCTQKLKTNDFEWIDSLWLEYDPSSPSALNRGLVVNMDEVREKLAAIRKRTKLRPKGDAWAIVYGRLETHQEIITGRIPHGRKAEWYGFGHLNGSPAQLVFKDKDVKFISEKEAQDLLKK